MSSPNRLVILSAGRGIGIEGFHKLHLVVPSTGETLLKRYMRQLSSNVTIVVGFRAPELMARNPELHFIYNNQWFETGSAHSASLGLSEGPAMVVPCDLIINEHSAARIAEQSGDVLFTFNSENRRTSAVNVNHVDGRILDIYIGPKRSGHDTEFKGIVRVQTPEVARRLAETCAKNPDLSFAQCIALNKDDFTICELPDAVVEINTTEEYFEFFEADKLNAHA